MFVRHIKKPGDHISIRIVENVRVGEKIKQRSVCCVGHFHKDQIEEIEARTRVAEAMIIKIQNDIRPSLPGLEEATYSPVKKNAKPDDNETINMNSLQELSRINSGIVDIFGEAYNQLNFSNLLETGYKQDEANELLKDLVLSRVEDPQSKKKSVENLELDHAKKVDLDKIYRLMDKVYKNEKRIKDKISFSTLDLLNRKIDVAFFDVTTLYFESFSPDELRNFGFSKDCKFKETQVMLALITTVEGLPLGYELYPGNMYEGNTLINVIEAVEKNYTLSEAFVIADRGMFNKENLSKLQEKKVKFIVAAKLKSMNKMMKEKILSDFNSIKNQNPDVEKIVKEYEYDGNRLIVSYSKKRAEKDAKDRDRLVTRIKKTMKDGKVLLADLINNHGTKKFLKIEKKESKDATINQKKIDDEKLWDGLHGVVTNHLEKDLTSAEILSKYKGLWQIEAAFRVNKHDLKMRPIYHWTPRRIKAHILICFIAYSLVTFIRYKLNKKNIKLSFAKIREELSRVEASILKDKKTGKKFFLPTQLNPTQESIYEALELSYDKKIRLIKD